MTGLAFPQKLLKLRTMSPWFALVALLSALSACILSLMPACPALEGPVRQSPNSTALWPRLSASTTSVAHCLTPHLNLQSNFVSPDSPDRVMDWYRSARLAYINQGG